MWTSDSRDATRPPSTVQAMQDEASAIWQHYGVQIQWPANRRDGQCPLVLGSFDVLVEYQLSSARHASRRPCSEARMWRRRVSTDVGIYVDYDETQSVIESVGETQLLGLAGHPDVGPVDIGRALGRVLAHEIGHVVLGAPGHQPFGLMRRSFGPADLVTIPRWAYTLSKKEVERLGLRERELREYEASASLGAMRLQVINT